MKICFECGVLNLDIVKFCNECGLRLEIKIVVKIVKIYFLEKFVEILR